MNPFETEAARYDQWFESPKGRLIFEQEVKCLRQLIGGTEGRWMEIGVGTGRFAEALDIREGIDPSEAVLKYASDRGVQTSRGFGEDLPYSDLSFDGLLMVVTICFLDDPHKAFKECRRVLKNKGCLIVGLVPADSRWGKFYMRKGKEGNTFYSIARFYTCEQVLEIAADTGFTYKDAGSCLYAPPDKPATDFTFRKGIDEKAGFVAMKFLKNENPL